MILAAGRGERLRPLTDSCPKPLIKVNGKPLILYHLQKLKAIGVSQVVVNSAWLSNMICSYLGDGSQFGLKIIHSVEQAGGLETAGGIIKALDNFNNEPFLVINGDTFIDADYSQFLIELNQLEMAHLFMVDNPPHNLKGDFSILNGKVIKGSSFTFSGVAVYNPKAFLGYKAERMPLKPLFMNWINKGQLSGSKMQGAWFDAGTIQRIDAIEKYIKENDA